MARSKRASARRSVLRRLTEIKESVSRLQDWWKAPGVIYVPPEERIDPARATRERQEPEYPENQRRYWSATISEIDDLSVALITLREYCLEQYQLTPER